MFTSGFAVVSTQINPESHKNEVTITFEWHALCLYDCYKCYITFSGQGDLDTLDETGQCNYRAKSCAGRASTLQELIWAKPCCFGEQRRGPAEGLSHSRATSSTLCFICILGPIALNLSKSSLWCSPGSCGGGSAVPQQGLQQIAVENDRVSRLCPSHVRYAWGTSDLMPC